MQKSTPNAESLQTQEYFHYIQTPDNEMILHQLTDRRKWQNGATEYEKVKLTLHPSKIFSKLLQK